MNALHATRWTHQSDREYLAWAREQSREQAEATLLELKDCIGQEKYEAWIDAVIVDGESWDLIRFKAREALAQFEQLADHTAELKFQNELRGG